MADIVKPLYGKVFLAGLIRTLTGLHIGASKESLGIAEVDNPVIRDPVTKEPYIPGSSFKGKLRSLKERESSLRCRDVGNGISLHACPSAEDAATCPVCRLFGTSGDSEHPGSNFPSRLRVRDAYFARFTAEKLDDLEMELPYTELKYENALNRITAAANPRPVERVPRGCVFEFEIVYDVESLEDLKGDLATLVSTLEMLADDSLGGMSSRGTGKVGFYILRFEAKKIAAYRDRDDSLVKKVIDASQEYAELSRKPWAEAERGIEDFSCVAQIETHIAEVGEFFGCPQT